MTATEPHRTLQNCARGVKAGASAFESVISSVNGPMRSMAKTMSKFLSMGMPLAEVIARSTVAPARTIGRDEPGTLSVGAEADVAVFQVREGRFGKADCGCDRMFGSHKLECVLSVRKGQIVYDPGGLSMPDWCEALDRHWVVPALRPDSD